VLANNVTGDITSDLIDLKEFIEEIQLPITNYYPCSPETGADRMKASSVLIKIFNFHICPKFFYEIVERMKYLPHYELRSQASFRRCYYT